MWEACVQTESNVAMKTQCFPFLFTDIPCDPATMVVYAARDDFCHRLSGLKLRQLHTVKYTT